MPQTAIRPRCATALLMWCALGTGVGVGVAVASDTRELQPIAGDPMTGLDGVQLGRYFAGREA